LIDRSGGKTDFADLSNSVFFRKNAVNPVIQLNLAAGRPLSRFDYLLEDGDSLVIPTFNNLIQISGDGHQAYQYGEVDTISAPYLARMRADKYIKDFAMGYAKRADRSGILVKYPNGKFSRTRNYGLFLSYPRVKPGAEISVVLKPEKVKNKKEVKFDVNQAIATVTAALTSFATIYVLLTR
jgi:hypothetical protein